MNDDVVSGPNRRSMYAENIPRETHFVLFLWIALTRNYVGMAINENIDSASIWTSRFGWLFEKVSMRDRFSLMMILRRQTTLRYGCRPLSEDCDRKTCWRIMGSCYQECWHLAGIFDPPGKFLFYFGMNWIFQNNAIIIVEGISLFF